MVASSARRSRSTERRASVRRVTASIIGCVFGSIVVASTLVVAAVAQPLEWAKTPRMQLDRQFAGPLQDTIIQRWRDPVDGSICYIYLPITAAHTPPLETGYVQYGANTIGSISCFAAPVARTAAPPPPKRVPPPPPSPDHPKTP
jgi:hypothetical protein